MSVETLGAFVPQTFSLFEEVWPRVSRATRESRSFPFLFQRGNSAHVMGTLANGSSPEDWEHWEMTPAQWTGNTGRLLQPRGLGTLDNDPAQRTGNTGQSLQPSGLEILDNDSSSEDWEH